MATTGPSQLAARPEVEVRASVAFAFSASGSGRASMRSWSVTDLFDVGAEALAIDRAVEDPRCGQPSDPQRGEKRAGLPAPARRARPSAHFPLGDLALDLPDVHVPARRGQARHFTQLDQVTQLVGVRDADPDLGFMARLLALCSLLRTDPKNRLQYVRRNGWSRMLRLTTTWKHWNHENEN